MYEIIRFYADKNKRARLIKITDSLKEAQEHCKDPKNRKADKWFDGYRKINELPNNKLYVL